MSNCRPALLCLLGVMLAGCDNNSDFADLQSFMDESRAQPKSAIEPLPKFPVFENFVYGVAAMRNPFQPPIKIDLTAKQKGSRDIKPDDTRVKQFLEDFNIESFTMVGTLANAGSQYALVSGANSVHRVRVGDYLGRNHGRIVGIDEGQIEVLEIVPDGEGGWLERPRSLSLKERS